MKNVLFVCIGNSCRSQIAEGFAHHYGADVMRASSAGLSSAPCIARETSEVMMEKGIELRDQFPKDFEPSLARGYHLIVNLSGFDLPPVDGVPVVEWLVEDPNGREIARHRRVRDEIEWRVKDLIREMRENKTTPGEALVGERIAPAKVRRSRLWQRFTSWL